MPSNKNKQCEGTTNLDTNYETNFVRNKLSKQNSESLLIKKPFSLFFPKKMTKNFYLQIVKVLLFLIFIIILLNLN